MLYDYKDVHLLTEREMLIFDFFFWDSVEYNVSYVYHSMYAYFDRDNVALKGLAKYFYLLFNL